MNRLLKVICAILTLAFSQLIPGCTKKQSPTATTIPAADSPMIAYFATHYFEEDTGYHPDPPYIAVGDTLQFLGKAAKFYNNEYHTTPAYKFVWDFGDGAFSSFSGINSVMFNKVAHVYQTPGNYFARLTIDDSLVADSMTVILCNDPVHTRELCTQKKWRGGKQITGYLSNDSTVSSLPDSSFSLVYRSKAIVSLWGLLYYYIPQASSADHLVFSSFFPLYHMPDTATLTNHTIFSSIYLDIATDSINLYHITNIYSGPKGSLEKRYRIFYHTP